MSGVNNPRRYRWSRSVAILLALALLAAACGSDGGDDGDGTTGEAAGTPAAGDEPTDPGDEPDDGDDGDDGDEPTPEPQEPPPVEISECPVGALEEADGPVAVEFWHAMSAINEDALSDLVDAYNAAQDRVQVTALFQGGYEDSFDKYVNTLRSGGDLPDMIQLNEVGLQQMVDSQSTIPIQACVDADGYDTSDFAGRLVEQYQISGVLVTMPFQLSNPVLYYDGADFVAAGLDPDAPPTTFDDLLDVSRSLVASGVVDKAIALENDAWIVEQWIAKGGAPLVDNDNGRAARATAANLDSPAATAVFELLATLRDEDLLIDTGRGNDQAVIGKYLALAFGDATLTIGTSANLGEIYNQLGAFPDIDLRVAPLPGPTEGGTAVGGGSLYLVEDTEPEVRAAVWDFMKWLNEPEQQVTWSIATGYIPTRQSAIDAPGIQLQWEERPGFRVAFDQLAAAGPLPGGGGPVIGDHFGVREAIEQGVERLLSGDDVADVQAEVQAQANEAIADYNRRIGE